MSTLLKSGATVGGSLILGKQGDYGYVPIFMDDHNLGNSSIKRIDSGMLVEDAIILNHSNTSDKGIIFQTSSNSKTLRMSSDSKLFFDTGEVLTTTTDTSMTKPIKFVSTALITSNAIPTQLGHGKLMSYSNMIIGADSDNGGTTEYVQLVASEGISPSSSKGVVVRRDVTSVYNRFEGHNTVGVTRNSISLSFSYYVNGDITNPMIRTGGNADKDLDVRGVGDVLRASFRANSDFYVASDIISGGTIKVGDSEVITTAGNKTISGSVAGTFTGLQIQNTSADSNAIAILRLLNNTSDLAGIYRNSSTRTADGGGGAICLYNNNGGLYFKPSTSSAGSTFTGKTNLTGLLTVGDMSNSTGELAVFQGNLGNSDAWITFAKYNGGDYYWQIKYVGSTGGTAGNEFRIESVNTNKYYQFDHDGNFEGYNGSSIHQFITSNGDIQARATRFMYARNFVAENNYGFVGKLTDGSSDSMLYMTNGNRIRLGHNSRDVVIYQPHIQSNRRVQFTNGADLAGSAQGINVGSILASDIYTDASKVPTNGAWIKGEIRHANNVGVLGRNGSGWVFWGNAAGSTYLRAYDNGKLEASKAFTVLGTLTSSGVTSSSDIILNRGSNTFFQTYSSTNRIARFGYTASMPSTSITGDLDSYIELAEGAGDGTSATGIVFHHAGISTSKLEYRNTNASTGHFNFVSDDTTYSLRVGGYDVLTTRGDQVVHGDITFNTTLHGIKWSMNTDGASITFKNTGDSDTDSYLEYNTNDNGNEYHKFTITSGSTRTEQMSIKGDGVRVRGLVSGQRYISTATTGTSPLQVSSTTVVANLNADMLDGKHADSFADKSLKRNIHRRFTVNGDANTYYPVVIRLGHVGFAYANIDISRGYSWTAPNTWHSATHKGGLTLSFRCTGDTYWGGNDSSMTVYRFHETYTTMVAGMGHATGGRYVVWLRGGGAIYQLDSEFGESTTVSVELGGFTDSASRAFMPRTDTSNVASEVLSRFANRDGSLYDRNNRVFSAVNLPNSSHISDATHNATANMVVKRDSSGGFLANAVTVSTLRATSNSRLKGTVFINQQYSTESDASISLAIGDSDTGFHWISDGIFEIRTDGIAMARINKATAGMTFNRKVQISRADNTSIGGTNFANSWLQVGTNLAIDPNEIQFNTNAYIRTSVGSLFVGFNGKEATFDSNGDVKANRFLNSTSGLGTTNTSSTSGVGLSLYGGASTGAPSYGMMFAGTATFGTHGNVTGDWATYLTMSNTTSRGWIFRRGTTNVASISGNGYLYASRVYNSVYNDYAEYFEREDIDEILEVGDIIELGDTGETFTKSKKAYSVKVVGVYSDSYGHILGGKGDENDDKHFVSVGLSGRVNVKVKGKIRKGDLITSSDIAGVGMRMTFLSKLFKRGCVIGKALEDKTEEGISLIKIFILNC